MDHLLARIYAIRDHAKLLERQTESVYRDVPAEDRDQTKTHAAVAARTMRAAIRELDALLVDLEVRQAIADLPADADNTQHEAAIAYAVTHHRSAA